MNVLTSELGDLHSPPVQRFTLLVGFTLFQRGFISIVDGVKMPGESICISS